jgi:hypothetical protein
MSSGVGYTRTASGFSAPMGYRIGSTKKVLRQHNTAEEIA